MHITDDNVQEFKKRMSIYYSHKDETLESLLKNSYLFLEAKCGEFSMTEENQGKELVFERARYAYHDSIEYFDENFMSMVMNFANRNLEELKPDENSDEQTLPET